MDIIDQMRSSQDFARGRAEAEADIGAGILGQRAYGKLAPWWEDAARVLKERYGIESQIVGWCITEMAAAAAAAGYNERMDEEITARFGSNVVAATWREVERKVKKHGAGYTRRAEPLYGLFGQECAPSDSRLESFPSCSSKGFSSSAPGLSVDGC